MYKFKKDAVVGFLGDSITARTKWTCRILDYYREINPDCTMKIFNAGRSGGVAPVAVRRMVTDLIPYNPTDVVIMFGMNDIKHELWNCENVTEELLKERAKALEEYEKALTTIADTLSEKGVNLIFCTPTPTNLNMITENPYKAGSIVGLQKASRIVKKLAENYGGHVVDFNTEFFDVMETLQEEDLYNTIVDTDRVHPSMEGQEVMAKLFLKAQGFDVPVYSTMAEWKAEAEKPLSEHTQPVYDVTMRLRALAFIEWGMVRDVPQDEIEAKLEAIYNGEDANDFVRSRIDMYREDFPKKHQLIEELIRIQ
ncbi:MAG: hypothetical protein IKW02_04480 [Clostridia bacterium]|nr:hypothetical protein [Clostridia bacterium]